MDLKAFNSREPASEQSSLLHSLSYVAKKAKQRAFIANF